MHPSFLSILLMAALLSASVPNPVESKSYFGIGNRQLGDQLLLRDELENRHTGLTEVPTIAFNYAIREPITYIEIVSDQNVHADVNFSYYNALINGTVTALSTLLKEEFKPFTVIISVYGYNEKMPELNPNEQLRQQLYYGPLVPSLEPGEEDHMEIVNSKENIQEMEYHEESTEEITSAENNDDDYEMMENEDNDENEESEEEDDNEDADENDTFESMDKIMTVGNRQPGDELIYETYQTSHAATELPTSHNVTFYFIDDVNITHIQFVIIDYFNNKTSEDIGKLKLIEYSHYTSSTFKAIIRDHKTTSLFAKMSVYGYKPENLPINYVSYIPAKVRLISDAPPMTTESPKMYLRAQINALQREEFPKLPSSFDMLRREGDFQYTVANAGEVPPSGNVAGANSAATNSPKSSSKITNLSIILPLGFVMLRAVCSLWTPMPSLD